MPVAARCPLPVLLPASPSLRSLLALLYGLTRIEAGVECYLSTGGSVVHSCAAAAARHSGWLPPVLHPLERVVALGITPRTRPNRTLCQRAAAPAKCIMVCCCCPLLFLKARCLVMP